MVKHKVTHLHFENISHQQFSLAESVLEIKNMLMPIGVIHQTSASKFMFRVNFAYIHVFVYTKENFMSTSGQTEKKKRKLAKIKILPLVNPALQAFKE